MNLNQLTIIGFIGKNAETKQLPNGGMITKFSIATTKSWKDDSGDWKSKTQWHNVIAFGQSYAQMAVRLLKGSLVFVQGELITREYDRCKGRSPNVAHPSAFRSKCLPSLPQPFFFRQFIA